VCIEKDLIYWDSFIDFVKVAMNATFNINRTSTFSRGFPEIKRPLPRIFVSSFLASPTARRMFVLPPFLHKTDVVYAVPRMLSSTVEWFRLVNELSDYVWYCLLTSLLFSIVFLYLLLEGRKDLAYVVLFTLQPLLGQYSRDDFLSRARIFLATWLLSFFVLQAGYLCTLLSTMSVPSNDDAIK